MQAYAALLPLILMLTTISISDVSAYGVRNSDYPATTCFKDRPRANLMRRADSFASRRWCPAQDYLQSYLKRDKDTFCLFRLNKDKDYRSFYFISITIRFKKFHHDNTLQIKNNLSNHSFIYLQSYKNYTKYKKKEIEFLENYLFQMNQMSELFFINDLCRCNTNFSRRIQKKSLLINSWFEYI